MQLSSSDDNISAANYTDLRWIKCYIFPPLYVHMIFFSIELPHMDAQVGNLRIYDYSPKFGAWTLHASGNLESAKYKQSHEYFSEQHYQREEASSLEDFTYI